MISLKQASELVCNNEPLPEEFYVDYNGDVQYKKDLSSIPQIPDDNGNLVSLDRLLNICANNVGSIGINPRKEKMLRDAADWVCAIKDKFDEMESKLECVQSLNDDRRFC